MYSTTCDHDCNENSICLQCQAELEDYAQEQLLAMRESMKVCDDKSALISDLIDLTKDQCNELRIDYTAYQIALESRKNSVLDDWLCVEDIDDNANILDTEEQEWLLPDDRRAKENRDMEDWANDTVETFCQEEITMLTVKEYAEKNNISERNVRRMCASGELKAEKVNRTWQIFSDSEPQKDSQLPTVYQSDEIATISKSFKNFVYQPPVVIVEVDPQAERAAEYLVRNKTITSEIFCQAMAMKSLQREDDKPKRKSPWSLASVAVGICILLMV